MDPLHIDPLATPAVVRPADDQEAELDSRLAADGPNMARTLENRIRIGELLAAFKARLPYGQWEAFLKRKGIAVRTASRRIRDYEHRVQIGQMAELEDRLAVSCSGTIEEDDKTCGENGHSEPTAGVQAGPQNPAAGGQNDAGQNAAPPGPKRPSDWSKEYRNRVFGLKITYPKLAAQLIDGKATMPADELWKFTAWMCRRCVRLGPPPVHLCPTCTANREQKQTDLFQSKSEPANPDDPTSPPEKPADRLARLRKLVIATQREATAALNDPAEECVRLREFLTACRVVDYQGGTPRFRALSGVAKVVDLAAKEDVDANEAKHQYEIASGAFVPPVFGRKRKKGA